MIYQINKMEVQLEYKKFDMTNIEESLDKNISFNIGKMHYKIILQNNNKLTTEKFIHSFLLFNEDFEQEVIAFLNYKEGGIIYVGINKNGQVVGVDNTDLTQLQNSDRIEIT